MNQKTKGQVDEEFIFYLIYLKPCQLVNLLTCPLNRPRHLVNSLTCLFNKPCHLVNSLTCPLNRPCHLVNSLTCPLKKPRQLVNSLTCPFNKPCQLKYTSSPNNLLIFQHLIHIFAPVGINLQVEQTIHDAGRIKCPGITRDTVAV